MPPIAPQAKASPRANAETASDVGCAAARQVVAKASARLPITYTAAQVRQANQLLEDIGGDLQLQRIVKEIISQHLKEKNESAKVWISIQPTVPQTVADRRRKAEDEVEAEENVEDDEPQELQSPGKLRRGHCVFAS